MNPFTTALIKAPKRARFDFSHDNTVSVRVGALTPTLSQFIIPGDEVAMSMEQICRLAPMPVPTFTPLKVRHDFFFVPLRLLYGVEYLDKLFGSDTSTLYRACCNNLAGFYTTFSSVSFDGLGDPDQYEPNGAELPVPGTIFDYLKYPVLTDRNGGLNDDALTALANPDPDASIAYSDFVSELAQITDIGTTFGSTPYINVEKIFAYHFIWRDWYRFTGIQDNTITEPFLSNGILSAWSAVDAGDGVSMLGSYLSSDDIVSDETKADAYVNSAGGMTWANLGQLKYAHLTKDMFTSVRYGSKPTVLIPTGANGTIPALREASAIQRFLDIISITGQRYFDKVKGLFGVEPVGAKDDRVQFLGRYQQFIKVGEVITTANTESGETGDYAGRGILIDGKYIFKRRFTEHGWLFCITSVIPDVSYHGLDRDLTDNLPIDTPLPSLAQVGDQTVFQREVGFFMSSSPATTLNSSFGDQFRYYFYKSANNEVHGFFLMDTAKPWSPLLPNVVGNVLYTTRVQPWQWNYLFNDTDDMPIFGDRFYFNLNFSEYITRALPKYINYHL